ncbi:Glycine/sarcosine N-methyltransferase [Thermoflexales bacterium]|nr:Glycine/sarcosine N-methyltransferase [Thermoflexales bacterium]
MKVSRMSETLVKNYYTGYVRKEWRRLIKDAYHRLEFETTLHFIKQHFPKNGLLLDAGGGPGRYTVALASRGYDMVMLDMTPANVAFAKRQIKRSDVQDRVKDVIEGSIVDLSCFDDNTFDGVICLGGPLSHVIDKRRRDKAIRELVRVAKPGAPIAVSVMSRLSVLVVELTLFPQEVEMPHYQKLLNTGDYRGQYGFTACHFFLPEELRAAFDDKGVQVLELVGLEGISSSHRKELNRIARNEKQWKIWQATHLKTCTHPAVVGTSEHMLLLARKL